MYVCTEFDNAQLMTVSRERTFKTVINAWHDTASSMHRARVHISHAVILQRLHSTSSEQCTWITSSTCQTERSDRVSEQCSWITSSTCQTGRSDWVSELFLYGTSAHIKLLRALPWYGRFNSIVLSCCHYGVIKHDDNQGYLATTKMNNKYIVKSKRENNENKNMSIKDKSVRL